MKPSSRVQQAMNFVAALLLLGGISAGQEPKENDWGKSSRGLQMRISLDRAATAHSEVPKFKVELRNVGEKDLLLNLGTMTRDGGQQYVNAVSLILVDTQGKPQWLEFKKSVLGGDARKEPFFLPLPIGATFSFPVELENYWAATSKEFEYRLKPGTYRLAAHLAGFIETDNYPQSRTERPGLQPIGGRSFDTVNPEVGLGPPPMSNTLKFEVSIR